MVEIGQLRRFNSNSASAGEVFIVIGFTEMTSSGERFVDYLSNGDLCWDDEDWVEEYSEVISEAG